MNILFCSKITAYGSTPVGGAENSMRFMAEALTKTDHKPVYLVYGIIKKETVTEPEIINGVEIYHHYTVHYPVFENIGYRFRIIGLVFWIEKAINMFLLKRFLKSFLPRHNIGIIYTSYDRDILLPLLKFKRTTKSTVRIVMRMAGLYWYERIKGDSSLLRDYEYIFNNVDSINYLSPSFKKLAESRMHELNMRVLPRHEFICDIGSGRAPNHVDILKKIDSKKFLIVVVMRFTDYQKRQDIVLHALALIQDTIPVEALFIGRGIRRDEMAELANTLGVSKRVTFAKNMDQQALWQAMAEADLLCHPCEYEGVSKIILESMALGLPVLASNVTPLQDYVCDGETGFLVDNEPEAWAEKIIFLYKNKTILHSVLLPASRYIQEYYNPDKKIFDYLEHFQSLRTEN